MNELISAIVQRREMAKLTKYRRAEAWDGVASEEIRSAGVCSQKYQRLFVIAKQLDELDLKAFK